MFSILKRIFSNKISFIYKFANEVNKIKVEVKTCDFLKKKHVCNLKYAILKVL